MKCKEAMPLLLSYLNQELAPSEHTLLQTHLSTCTTCQGELSRLFHIQGQIGSVLQRRANQATPTADAWAKLENRLMEDAQPSSPPVTSWFLRLAPGASRLVNQFLSGGLQMRRSYRLSAAVGVLVLVIAAFFTLQNSNRVSATEILDHAYAAQQNVPNQGIRHTRSIRYANLSAEDPEDIKRSQGTATIQVIVESYVDLQSGKFREVVYDSQSGNILEANAFDGQYSYSSDYPYGIDGSKAWNDTPGKLSITRTKQNVSPSRKEASDADATPQETFEQMRNSPNALLVAQEQWAGGRTVYALQYQRNLAKQPTTMILYFDVNTYQLVGSKATIQQNDEELLVHSQTIEINVIMPTSQVAWDLSDLPGVTVVDIIQ